MEIYSSIVVGQLLDGHAEGRWDVIASSSTIQLHNRFVRQREKGHKFLRGLQLRRIGEVPPICEIVCETDRNTRVTAAELWLFEHHPHHQQIMKIISELFIVHFSWTPSNRVHGGFLSSGSTSSAIQVHTPTECESTERVPLLINLPAAPVWGGAPATVEDLVAWQAWVVRILIFGQLSNRKMCT